MEFHKIQVWHIYKCPTCNASNPPKDKYVVIVHKQNKSLWGFFINSNVPNFILMNSELSKSQIAIKPEECPQIIKHISHIGCNELKEFYDWELNNHYCSLKDDTKNAVLAAVEISVTIDPEKIQIIKNSNKTL